MDNIRNFCIIAHIDHGKSTLADRFLELTKTIPREKMRPQYLDMMDLEREKGITIKMQPVRMVYKIQNSKSEILNKSKIQNSKFKTDSLGFSTSDLEFADSEFILNLIDTPGHVDFSYEVSRSLAAVEGAILLVDATKGIQAQTLANLELAKKQNLVIIPVINKIDLSQARIEETKAELAQLLNIPTTEVFAISAKEGTNVEKLLKAVIEKFPSPKGSSEKPFRALIFDSKYDPYKGIIAYVRVVDGKVQNGDKIYLMQTETEGEVKEVGYFKPERSAVKEIEAGEIGYLATGIKEAGKVRVGETITKLIPKQSLRLATGQEIKNLPCTETKFLVQGEKLKIKPLPGYKEPKPTVFLSVFPENSNNFELLKDSIERLRLNDAALTFQPQLKEGLGRGFQCGFLGLLHAEIFSERLKREFGLNLVLSTPSVIYKILTTENKEILVHTPADWPASSKIKETLELWTRLRILTPLNYLGKVLELLKIIESKLIKTNYLSREKVELIAETPLREIITKNFYDKLKSISQGFSSMDYEILDWRTADLIKLDILILGKKEETLSRILPKEKAYFEGKKMVEKLKEVLPPQLFSLPIQAAIGGKIIARETIKAKRRDVLSPLYGGDYTRKRKLLEKQKRGKKELKEKVKKKGRLIIPPRVFLEIF